MVVPGEGDSESQSSVGPENWPFQVLNQQPRQLSALLQKLHSGDTVHEAVTRGCKEQHRQIEARFSLRKRMNLMVGDIPHLVDLLWSWISPSEDDQNVFRPHGDPQMIRFGAHLVLVLRYLLADQMKDSFKEKIMAIGDLIVHMYAMFLFSKQHEELVGIYASQLARHRCIDLFVHMMELRLNASLHVKHKIFLSAIEYLPFSPGDDSKGTFEEIMDSVLSRSREIKLGKYDKSSDVAEQHRLQSLQKAMAIQWLCFTPPSTITDAKAVSVKLLLRALIHRPSLIPAKSSGHISIRSSLSLSLIPVISPCSQSQGRKHFPVSRIVVRKHSPPATFPANFSGEFSGELSGDGFFLHRKERLEEISNLSQSTEPETHPRAAHARFSGRRLHLTRRRVRAREPLSGDALPPPGSPDADQPPFLPVCAIRALHVPLLGVLLPFRSMTKYGMASSQVSSVTSPESGGRSEIPNLGGNDSSPILITGHKLNGHNYLQWSQSVLLFICGKGKDEYLTGEAVMPETTEPGFRKWKIENSMIMSWLINSMNNDIGENFLLFGTAKDIWDAAKETYSSSENTSELFQVESALHDFRQGEQSVTQYYNTLTSNIQANCGTKETVQVLPRTKQGIG
ncbi:Nuclear pore complex protein NUP107 [Vitis vinifera]|uniref:Nuclear pore complex protein n=1 Tax=Vitis vinifera TaxID=29760 RepID=A0A438EWZ6_VITVI|nr:Nuclear pore complex protein NUP107 [Vitis vinifera]